MELSLNKKIGIVLVLLGLITLFVQLEAADHMGNMGHEACSSDSQFCTPTSHVPPEYWLGIASSVAVIVLGAYLFRQAGDQISEPLPSKWKDTVKSLTGTEKQIFDALVEEDGSVMQSALVKKTGLSKVKVTRTLDKLEGKGLLERRRAGMSNAIILKVRP